MDIFIFCLKFALLKKMSYLSFFFSIQLAVLELYRMYHKPLHIWLEILDHSLPEFYCLLMVEAHSQDPNNRDISTTAISRIFVRIM